MDVLSVCHEAPLRGLLLIESKPPQCRSLSHEPTSKAPNEADGEDDHTYNHDI